MKKNPFDFENALKFFGDMNKLMYGINPYEEKEPEPEKSFGNYPAHDSETRFCEKHGL